MNIQQLIEKFPWADHIIVRTFAESFSEEIWEALTNGGVDKLIVEDKVSDQNLFKIMNVFCELANREDIQQAIASNQITFKEIVEANIEDALKEIAKKDEKEGINENQQPFKSAVKYLSTNGFNQKSLADLFEVLGVPTAIEHSYAAAIAISAPDVSGLTMELFKKHTLDLLYAQFSFNKTDSVEAVLDFFENKLTYELFKNGINSGKYSLFKPNVSEETYQEFMKKSLAMLNFIKDCITMLEPHPLISLIQSSTLK